MSDSASAIATTLAETLVSALVKQLSSMVQSFSTKLVEQNEGLKYERVIAVWNEIAPGYEIDAKTAPVKKAAATATATKTKNTSSEITGTCIRLGKRGDNANKPCGNKVSVNSVSGNYCSRHIKEEENDGSPTSAAAANSSETKSTQCEQMLKTGKQCANKPTAKSGRFCSRHAAKASEENSSPSSSKQELVVKKENPLVLQIKKHKELNVHYDPATSFVIHKETENKPVYAKIKEDALVELTTADIELLKKKSISYDLKLFKQLHPDEEEAEAEEEEEEEAEEE